MRENVRAFCRCATKIFSLEEPIYEFGAYQVEGRADLADLRGLFPGQKYVGCDARLGPGVDRIEDVESLSLPDESASTVLCLDTLEHVFHVHNACAEMYRVLRPGGIFIASVPFQFRIHAYPDDFWRITPSCFRRLLEPFGARLLAVQGVKNFPHTVMVLAVKNPVPFDFPARADRLAEAFHVWIQGKKAALGWAETAKRLLFAGLRIKGEHNRLRGFHDCEFVIEQASEWSLQPIAAQPLAHGERRLGAIVGCQDRVRDRKVLA